MTGSAGSQRADLEKTVRMYGGYWDTDRSLRALRDAGHDPQDKHTRRILRDLASDGLLVKVEDRPVKYRLAEAG
ncbi:hypothetical protein ADK65_34250 [Streptomyces sp. NRRL B-1140]|uniref:hypothetical protein n=1 Tax=Streptomyces sp. NRRL B-1140 TaxID=1415549 RepID=UPI0006AFCFA9|nr:hypothetical protein [Streptomyces sp. NRRL B-1140]KOV92644.1 hypothetical protein ADK65_34250 [Streptomyces sp. NRRL B-1140]